MAESGIEHLSRLVNPETRGVVWLTDSSLNYDSPGAYEINYLLNGVLVQSLANRDTSPVLRSNFFLGNNFGKGFFVAHSVFENKTDIDLVYKGLEVAAPFLEDGSQVYILNRSKNTAGFNLLKELQANKKLLTSNKNIKFEHLNI